MKKERFWCILVHFLRLEMPLILGRSVAQHVVMVTKLLNSHCGAHLLESYFKNRNISDTIWPRNLLMIIDQNLVWSISRHYLPWVPEDIFFLSISWRRSCVNEEKITSGHRSTQPHFHVRNQFRI